MKDFLLYIHKGEILLFQWSETHFDLQSSVNVAIFTISSLSSKDGLFKLYWRNWC